MGNTLNFIKNYFSTYTIILFLFSASILIFVDKKQLIQKGLKKEAKFSLIMGIAYAAIAVAGFLIKNVLPSR